jgi:hypothetical protein
MNLIALQKDINRLNRDHGERKTISKRTVPKMKRIAFRMIAEIKRLRQHL